MKTGGSNKSLKVKTHSRKEENGDIPMLLHEFKLGKIDCAAMSETRMRILENGEHPKIRHKDGFNVYFLVVLALSHK